jgi:hypothetical protein
MIYLASPYSHRDPEIRQKRYEAAVRASARLASAGIPVYSPIAHSHPIEVATGGLIPHTYWMSIDLMVLPVCSKMVVLRLPGWEESKGVAKEIDAAGAAGIPVIRTDLADVVWAAEAFSETA